MRSRSAEGAPPNAFFGGICHNRLPSGPCTSIAPNPPTMMSSSTCSASDRNESSGFGASKLSVRNPHSRGTIRNRLERIPLPRLHSPPHPRNAILDAIDRPPRNRRLRKSPQVVRRGFGHRLTQRPIRVKDRRQSRSPPLLRELHVRGAYPQTLPPPGARRRVPPL